MSTSSAHSRSPSSARRSRTASPSPSPGSTARVFVVLTTFTSENVIAELPGKNDGNVVMAGAHLDSVPEGPGHQRQRQRLGGTARGRPEPRQPPARQHGAVRLVGRRGARPDRIDRSGSLSDRRRSSTEIALYLNFDMIGSSELLHRRLRRRPVVVRSAGRRAGRFDRHRGRLRVVLHPRRRAVRRHRVQRPQRLPGVHQQRHPVERPVHRRGGREDRGAGGDLGRHGRRPVRPVLPPGV